MILCFNLNPACDKTLEVPGFHVGGHLKARTLAFIPAGKGLNVARGLAALGEEALGLGFIGAGEYEWFADELEKAGAQADFTRVSGRTRTNTTIVDPDRNTATHLREEGLHIQQADKDALHQTVTNAFGKHKGRIAIISGSLPPGFDEADLHELIVACRRGGARVFVDTSGAPLKAAADAGVALIKPNEQELTELAGRPLASSDVLPAAQALLERVHTVLVSLGAEGGIAVTSEGAWGAHLPLPEREVVNTVGCGDAFLAGWTLATVEGHAPDEAILWAVAAGTACVTLPTAAGYDRRLCERMLARCEPFVPEG